MYLSFSSLCTNQGATEPYVSVAGEEANVYCFKDRPKMLEYLTQWVEKMDVTFLVGTLL